jgi:SAM-dependent methyltransferase
VSDDRVLAESFGSVAETYDAARDSYPASLVDELVFDTSMAVLDVGCGTGIASRLFKGRGCAVLGIEPDQRMAAVAKGHGIGVEVSRFEDWDPAGRRFDLVIAATAWHWINVGLGPTKADSALRSQGTLAPFWNSRSLPNEVMAAVVPAYRRHAPNLLLNSTALGTAVEDYRPFVDAITDCGGFEAPELRTYPWERTFSTKEFLDELSTHSSHTVLMPSLLSHLLEEVATAVDRLGGSFVSDYKTVAIVARKR